MSVTIKCLYKYDVDPRDIDLDGLNLLFWDAGFANPNLRITSERVPIAGKPQQAGMMLNIITELNPDDPSVRAVLLDDEGRLVAENKCLKINGNPLLGYCVDWDWD